MKERVLIIGSGPNGFGRETEGDVAAYQMASALLDRHYDVFLIDNNPYSFTASRPDIDVITADLTLDNVLATLESYNITAIVPTVGSMTAINLTANVVQSLGDQAPKLFGTSYPAMQAAQNTKYLQERLEQLNLPAVQTRLATNAGEVFDAARELDFPVVLRPIATPGPAVRLQADDADDLDQIAQDALRQSLTHQVNVDKSIRGYREIALVVMRDRRDTTLMIGGVEDLDPVGVHSADSIAITPIQTLSDPITETLRTAAFKVARGFKVEGLLEVRFAVRPEDESYVITRIVPYYDRKAALITAATGYPLVPVMTGVMLGERLDKVTLPGIYANHTALLEPTMDHIAIRFPVFAFRELEKADILTANRLDTVQKSVGATIGVGRSVEEALEKAIRAAHFNNVSFSPTVMNALTDSELIEQLIHPRDNRIFVLMEAIRRGYTVDELAELTKIDPFYFYKIEQIMTLEQSVREHPWDIETLKAAKYYGLSDGLVARLWNTVYDSVRRYRWDNNVLPTYKAFEPSAGEFPEAVAQFYSTFEDENESERLGDHTALIIGSGAFRLGDGAAASYVEATVADELKALGWQTVLMNNNPHDLLFVPQLGDKRYFEPIEISDVMNVVEIEQPSQVFVPGNRIKLIQSLRAVGLNVQVIPHEKYLPSTMAADGATSLINYFCDGQALYPVAISEQSNEQVTVSQPKKITEVSLNLPEGDFRQPGLYQSQLSPDQLVGTDLDVQLRPMPFVQVALLEKVSGYAWMRMAIRYMVGQETQQDQAHLLGLKQWQWLHHRGTLKYVDDEFIEHMHIHGSFDNGRFAIGAQLILDD